MPDVDWYERLPVENSLNALHSAFYELIQVDGLHQFADLQTRFGTTGSSVLDILFTNDTDLVESVTILPGIIDHEIVLATINCERTVCNEQRPRKLYMYDSGNYGGLTNELDTFFPTFLDQINRCNMNDLWTLFKEQLLHFIAMYIPSRLISGKQRSEKPWMNAKLSSSIKAKSRIFKKYRKTAHPALYNKLNSMNKKLKNELWQAKYAYLSGLADKIKTNPKEVWRYIKTTMRSQS